MRSRRSFLAAAGLSIAIAGCGRSGPSGSGNRPGTLTIDEIPGAGEIVASVDGVEVATCPGTCSVDFEAGAVVSLLATPAAANHSGWTGGAEADCAPTANPCVFTPSGDTQAGAYWTATVTVDPVPDGWGRVIANGLADCVDLCPVEAPFGEQTSFDAVEIGPFFLSWTGPCEEGLGEPTCTVTPAEDLTLRASFSLVGRATIAGTAGGDEYGASVTPDPLVSGGYFLAGGYETAGFSLLGGAPLTLAGAWNAFVSRVSPTDSLSWIESYGGLVGSEVAIHAIAADGDAVCYAAGSVTGSVDLAQNGTPVNATGDINGFLLAHPVAEATPSWVQTVVGSNANSRSVLSDLDREGTLIAVTGLFSDGVTFAGATFETGGGANRRHLLTAVLGANGVLASSVSHGRNGDGHAEGTAIEFFPDGDPLVAGFFDLEFDRTDNGSSPCGITDATTDMDLTLFRLNATDFDCEWGGANKIELGGQDRATGVAEQGGRAYVAGVRLSTQRQVAVHAFNAADGTTAWSVSFPTSGIPGPFGLDDDADRGELVLAGSFRGEIDVGTETFVSAGGLDVLVIRLDAENGDVVSVTQVGGAGDDAVGGPRVLTPSGGFFDFNIGYAAGAVAVLDSSQAVITGWTMSTSFAGAPTSGEESADLFVIRETPPP